MATNFGTKLL